MNEWTATNKRKKTTTKKKENEERKSSTTENKRKNTNEQKKKTFTVAHGVSFLSFFHRSTFAFNCYMDDAVRSRELLVRRHARTKPPQKRRECVWTAKYSETTLHEELVDRVTGTLSRARFFLHIERTHSTVIFGLTSVEISDIARVEFNWRL